MANVLLFMSFINVRHRLLSLSWLPVLSDISAARLRRKTANDAMHSANKSSKSRMASLQCGL